MTNRWLPIAGGILMNLALGSLYAWSVFVLPLEKEFGWTRAQTSWVFTIAIVCFAADVHRRRADPGSQGPADLRVRSAACWSAPASSSPASRAR